MSALPPRIVALETSMPLLPGDTGRRSEIVHPTTALAPLNGIRVVVVEDEGVIHLYLRRLLAQAGAIVVGAVRSGPEAVARVAETLPDLVLTEVHLPGPCDGIETIRQITQIWPAPVVVLSSLSGPDIQRRAREAGADAYLTKPLAADQIVLALAEVLDRAR